MDPIFHMLIVSSAFLIVDSVVVHRRALSVMPIEIVLVTVHVILDITITRPRIVLFVSKTVIIVRISVLVYHVMV